SRTATTIHAPGNIKPFESSFGKFTNWRSKYSVRRLKDKVIWITGACGGLGKNFCKAFLGEGASICLTDVDEDLIADALREFDAAEKMMGAVVDVCRRSTIEASVSRMVAQFGKLDALVNVAGGSLYTPNKFEDIDEGSWDKVVDVNLKGTFLCSQAAVDHIRKQGRGGKIVNVSALAGRWLGSLAGCHYTAAKAGVIGLTRHLAYELGPEGIYVNAIAPTITFASQRTVDLWNKRSPEYRDRIISEIPLRRVSEPQEVAASVIFLLSDEASYITGVTLDINGGRFFS
ncbi:MAG: SDR family oxidoreductase, partial [Desulfobacterales bacterium]|nr:SDR family oxidoreductase [Desulfobacterales bacterium]